MSDNLIKIGIVGAAGRMGKKLIKSIIKNKRLKLTAAFEKENSDFIGIDVGKLVGLNFLNIKICEFFFIKKKDFDILIYFSSGKNFLDYLHFCENHKKSMIIGTTNLDKININFIKIASKNIPIILSENFSIGINVILNFLNSIVKIIGNLSDINIIEYHHKYKKDIPSGTAIAIGKIIAKSIGLNFDKFFFHNKKNILNKKKNNTINFSCIRSGDVIGEHTIIFFMNKERIEITHKIYNRNVYVNGVIKSCLWLIKKNNGLFSMLDVLDIKM